jgi:thymidine phosphorylase
MPAPVGVEALIAAYTARDVDDETMTRWLRGVCENGLSEDDTFALTMAMARSGRSVDWSGVAGPIVDKHSTGGVGDAVSLIAVALAAACGVKVAKLSGRALGHTGGTIDKLECIPGLRTDISIDAFRAQVDRVGCAIAASTDTLAPADKRLYALRHRTGTVASIPLIAASIMSKKIAGGAQAMAIDVKTGPGAFMQSLDDARALALAMRGIGRRAGLSVATLITRMDEPLADSAGDALELDEALMVMEDRGGSPALREVALRLAAAMLRAAGRDGSETAAALADGSAMKRFAALAAAQGGRLEAFDRSWGIGRDVTASRSGTIAAVDVRGIGEIVARAKATPGGARPERFGARMRRRVGERVVAGEPVMTWWLPGGFEVPDDLVVIGDAPVQRLPLIVEVEGEQALR